MIAGLVACALTGFCVSMLWPGSLIAATDRISNGGVFLFAIMAAGGDLGASVGPLALGVATDAVIAANPSFIANLPFTAEQIGMKLGMLIGMLFPLAATAVFITIKKKKKL
jgi:MFS family permease